MRYALERRGVAIITVATLLAACSASQPEQSPRGPHLSVGLAPLVLPRVTDACYALAVVNAEDALVLSRGPVATLADPARNPAYASWQNPGSLQDSEPICASRFGNGPGGDWSYVTPCDADAPLHTVTLWLETLAVTGQVGPLLPGADYQDPCPRGCALQATCVENADTPVTFNITVMRRADQGFFDIGVTFDNVFCSAKVDCTDGSGAPLALLHHPDTGERAETVVIALSCAAGSSDGGTILLRDPLVIQCDSGTLSLDPTLGEGIVYGNLMADPDPTDAIWQYATYFGQEALTCGAASCEKVYWNVVLGIDPAAAGCTLSTTATAGSSGRLPGTVTPEGASWPVIEVNVPLTLAGGGLACARHPLNGEPTGVTTTYTAVDAAIEFDHRFDGVEFSGPSGGGPSTVAYMEAIEVPRDGTVYYAGTPQEITGLALWDAVDAFVAGLKDNDLWDRAYAIYPFIGGTAVAHAFNLVDPRDADDAYRLSYAGGIVHSPTGYKPNGVDGFADTHLGNAALPQDSLSMGSYNREGGNSGFEISGGAAPRTQLIAKYSNGNTYFDTNNASNASLYQSAHTGRGFYLSSRIVSTEVKLFIEGVLDRTLQSASLTPQDVTFLVSRWQGGGIFSTRELSFVLIGEGYSDAEAEVMTTLVRALQQALARDVDPN